MTTVAETFERMQQAFNPSAAAGLSKTIQWNITGTEAGTWAVKIADQQCQVTQGSAEKADLTLTVSDKDWIDIASGKLDAISAFMSGKVKASGDLMLAPRIQNIFPRG